MCIALLIVFYRVSSGTKLQFQVRKCEIDGEIGFFFDTGLPQHVGLCKIPCEVLAGTVKTEAKTQESGVRVFSHRVYLFLAIQNHPLPHDALENVFLGLFIE